MWKLLVPTFVAVVIIALAGLCTGPTEVAARPTEEEAYYLSPRVGWGTHRLSGNRRQLGAYRFVDCIESGDDVVWVASAFFDTGAAAVDVEIQEAAACPPLGDGPGRPVTAPAAPGPAEE